MLALNIIVRAVIVHEGQLLLTALDDGRRELFYTFLGGHLDIRETLVDCVRREVREEVGLEIAPSRLLYMVENFFFRGASKLHELGFYFLCHPVTVPAEGLLASLRPALTELISPELISLEQLASLNFQPGLLRQALLSDVPEGFKDCPRLLVVNELPGEASATTGSYRL